VRPVVKVLEPDTAADSDNNAGRLETSCGDIHNRLGSGRVWCGRWSVAAATARQKQRNQEESRPLPQHDAEMIAAGR
jgi:hypothetical protein